MSEKKTVEMEAREQYRVVGKQVQCLWRGQWVTASYCTNEAAAKRSLERHIKRAVEWEGMSENERMAAILREPPHEK